MASFKCSGCGRTDFFTSHGFAKHGRKCKGKRSTPSVNSQKWAGDVKRRGFSGAPKSGSGYWEVSDKQEGDPVGMVQASSLAAATAIAHSHYGNTVNLYEVTDRAYIQSMESQGAVERRPYRPR